MTFFYGENYSSLPSKEWRLFLWKNRLDSSRELLSLMSTDPPMSNDFSKAKIAQTLEGSVNYFYKDLVRVASLLSIERIANTLL